MLHQFRISCNPVGAIQKQLPVQFLIIREYRTAFSAGNGLHRMETKRSHIGNGAVGSAFVFGSDYVGTILYQGKAVFFTDLHDAVQLHGLSCIIHHYHRFRLIGNGRLHFLRVNIVSFRIDVGENRPCAAIQSAVCRCGKGDRRSNHLISFSHPGCHRRHMKRSSSVAAHYRIPGACQPAQFILQLFDLRPTCQIVALQDLHHGLNVSVIYVLMSVINFRFPDGYPTLDCRFVHYPRLPFHSICISCLTRHTHSKNASFLSLHLSQHPPANAFIWHSLQSGMLNRKRTCSVYACPLFSSFIPGVSSGRCLELSCYFSSSTPFNNSRISSTESHSVLLPEL